MLYSIKTDTKRQLSTQHPRLLHAPRRLVAATEFGQNASPKRIDYSRASRSQLLMLSPITESKGLGPQKKLKKTNSPTALKHADQNSSNTTAVLNIGNKIRQSSSIQQ